MTGPATPGQEGPSYAPPPLPEGWIAQWDGMSRKYYFVQLSTGASQWDTPTHAAPTGPTPQATPQGVAEHPYGTPGQEQIITNQDGSQSIRYPDGRVVPLPADGDRSLSGDIGKFAMNQFMGGGKKQNHGSSSGGGLGALAGQFLGGGSKPNHGSSSSGPAAGIVGALAGSLLGGGKKPNQAAQQTSYSGSTPQGQSHGGGFMDNIGGMFGGHHQAAPQANSFGYSQHNNQQGGYTGAAPPSAYTPSGTAHTSYNAPPSNPQQPPHSQPPYGSHDQPYGSTAHPQQPSYGASPTHPQQPYGSTPQHPSQPPYGGIQHQDSYGGGAPPQHGQPQHGQYPGPPSYGGQPQYGAPPSQHSGNLPQPQHGHFQGIHNQEHSGGLYGNPGQGPPPGQGQYGAPTGGYGGQQQQPGGRW